MLGTEKTVARIPFMAKFGLMIAAVLVTSVAAVGAKIGICGRRQYRQCLGLCEPWAVGLEFLQPSRGQQHRPARRDPGFRAWRRGRERGLPHGGPVAQHTIRVHPH